jgi:hypothetical protein
MTSGSHLHGALEVAAPAHAHAHVDSPLMWLSHTAAALVTLVLLRGAETAAWRLLAEFARLVVAPFRTPAVVPVPRPRPATPTRRPPLLTARLLDRAVSRRGPPLPAAF